MKGKRQEPYLDIEREVFDASGCDVGPILNKIKLQEWILNYPLLSRCKMFNFQRNKIRKIDLCRRHVEELQVFQEQPLGINLGHNLLVSIDFQNAAFYHLTHLNLNFNTLTALTNLGYLTNLKELNLSYNRLTCLHFLIAPSLSRSLQVLRVDHNLISRVEDIVALTLMHSLVSLSLHGNPLRQASIVEAFVIYSCPQLVTLDRSPITKQTRDQLQNWITSEPEWIEMKRSFDAFGETLMKFLQRRGLSTSLTNILH